MKPDKRTCRNCNKDITDTKGTWCSDKCRMAFKRTNPNKDSEQPEQSYPNSLKMNPNKFRDLLSNTDKSFYDRAMRDFGESYYLFSSKQTDKQCILQSCKLKFKTSLALLRYCSYDHYADSLGGKK